MGMSSAIRGLGCGLQTSSSLGISRSANGTAVSGVGSTRIPPHAPSYPLSVHPDGYMYTWERGRVLHEYSAIYIANGKGSFESTAGGAEDVKAGTVILLFPGEWHRYRPALEDASQKLLRACRI